MKRSDNFNGFVIFCELLTIYTFSIHSIYSVFFIFGSVWSAFSLLTNNQVNGTSFLTNFQSKMVTSRENIVLKVATTGLLI